MTGPIGRIGKTFLGKAIIKVINMYLKGTEEKNIEKCAADLLRFLWIWKAVSRIW